MTYAQQVGAIGICLSGGGYRAAGFHLGTLEYLDAVGLGANVEQLSTVSGGTFVGAALAKSQVERRSFEEFFVEFHHFLRDTNLVKLGLRGLAGSPPRTPSGRHDLIVAMAGVYARTFMADRDGQPFLFGAVLEADIQLKEAVFNATEFRHGIAFRFQRSASRRACIGNRRLNIPRAEAGGIRMADVVAASSCFPGGFEPLAFPFDFVWPGGSVPPGIAERFTRGGKPFPAALMDGGIYDNQGAESLLLADERDVGDLGMFIISDVDQPSPDLYPFPAADTGDSGPTLGRMRLYAILVSVMGVASLIALGVHTWRQWSAGDLGVLDGLFLSVPLLLAGLVVFALIWIQRTLRTELLPQVPLVGSAAWDDLKKLRLTQVLAMVQLRLGSLLALTSSVFMKRIRGLVYGLVYRDERYKGKRVSNLIYHLASGSSWPAVLPAEVPQPSPELRRVVDVAADMPTSLWFDEPHELPCLVAAGQATICFNLMKWVARHRRDDPTADPPPMGELWDRLLADWRRFVERPYWRLEERLAEERHAPPPGADLSSAAWSPAGRA